MVKVEKPEGLYDAIGECPNYIRLLLPIQLTKKGGKKV